MWLGGQHHTLAALPPGQTRYPLYRGLVGPLIWSAQVRKTLPPPGLDPQTIQPLASCYTDYAMTASHGQCCQAN